MAISTAKRKTLPRSGKRRRAKLYAAIDAVKTVPNVASGTTYSMSVTATNACTTTPITHALNIDVQDGCVAPSISAPANFSTVAGSTSQQSLTVSGTGPFTVTSALPAGKVSASITGSLLTVTHAPDASDPAASGSWSAQVSGACGAATVGANFTVTAACVPCQIVNLNDCTAAPALLSGDTGLTDVQSSELAFDSSITAVALQNAPSWLSAAVSSPANVVAVAANPGSSVAAGPYSATLQVTNACGTSSIPINMVISDSSCVDLNAGSIGLSPGGELWTTVTNGVAGGAYTHDLTLGAGSQPVTATITEESIPGAMVLSLDSNDPATLHIATNIPAGTAPGTYNFRYQLTNCGGVTLLGLHQVTVQAVSNCTSAAWDVRPVNVSGVLVGDLAPGQTVSAGGTDPKTWSVVQSGGPASVAASVLNTANPNVVTLQAGPFPAAGVYTFTANVSADCDGVVVSTSWTVTVQAV